MKNSQTLTCILALFGVLTSMCSCVSNRYRPTNNEEMYGTWINEEYNSCVFPGKLVVNPDRTWEMFVSISDSDPFSTGKFLITDKWTDEEGNVWYKNEVYVFSYLEVEYPGDTVSAYEIWKIDKYGTMKENWMGNTDYPTNLAPLRARIHYRQFRYVYTFNPSFPPLKIIY